MLIDWTPQFLCEAASHTSLRREGKFWAPNCVGQCFFSQAHGSAVWSPCHADAINSVISPQELVPRIHHLRYCMYLLPAPICSHKLPSTFQLQLRFLRGQSDGGVPGSKMRLNVQQLGIYTLRTSVYPVLRRLHARATRMQPAVWHLIQFSCVVPSQLSRASIGILRIRKRAPD